MSPFRGSVAFTERWHHFRFDCSDGVATVTLDRPDKLNALTFESYADLRDLLAELPQRGDAKVLVLRGEGGTFCSGGDVHEIIGETLKMDPDGLLDFTRMTGDVVKAMRECPLPIVAAIDGTAAGAGSVLALAADFRVVARSAKFAFLFTKVGLSGADMGSAYLLPRIVGLGNATKLLMLGDTVRAEEADRYGLVSELVEDGEVDRATEALARRLASGPSFGYAQTKALLSRELDMSLSGALELEAMTQALLMKSADYAEFHAAFTAKRTPDWQGPLMAHELITPEHMAPAVGFSHAVVAEPGRTVYLGGQTAQRPDGSITGDTLVEQFDVALSNLVTTLTAAGCEPEHLVSMTVYTTDAAAYRASLRDLGGAYRRHLGKHYPAMALFEISGLFDPEALVEIVATAVRPDHGA